MVVTVWYLNTVVPDSFIETFFVSWEAVKDGKPLAWVSIVFTFLQGKPVCQPVPTEKLTSLEAEV